MNVNKGQNLSLLGMNELSHLTDVSESEHDQSLLDQSTQDLGDEGINTKDGNHYNSSIAKEL